MIPTIDGFSNDEIENMLAALGMVIGQGDGDAFGHMFRQAEERKGRDDRFEQKDPCPICGFTLRTDTFSVFAVPEVLVQKYGREKYIKEHPEGTMHCMHMMCAFLCYRQEYDARQGKRVEPDGYCPVCGTEDEHHPTCEIGHLHRALTKLDGKVHPGWRQAVITQALNPSPEFMKHSQPVIEEGQDMIDDGWDGMPGR